MSRLLGEQPRLCELGSVRVCRAVRVQVPLGRRALRVPGLRLHEHARHPGGGGLGQRRVAHAVPRPERGWHVRPGQRLARVPRELRGFERRAVLLAEHVGRVRDGLVWLAWANSCRTSWSIVGRVVLDREFFMREFALRVQRFSEERDSLPVRVILSTAAGRDFDVQRMTTSNAGIALHTREDSLIFMPYDVIEHIEVSIAQDRRVEGFEIPTESDFGS